MADGKPAPAEVDVDSLDDEAFAKLKDEMVSGADESEETKTAVPVETEEAKASRERDEQGRFKKAGDEDEIADDGKQKFVPHGQFHQANERRKAAEARAAELEGNFTKLSARVAELTALREQPAPQQEQHHEPAGPPKGDPMAMLEWLTERVQHQEITQAEARQLAQQEGYRQEHIRQLAAVEEQYRTATPDYDQAIAFAAESRDRELQIMFPMATAEQRRQYVLQEWENLVNASLQSGLNPAEQVYKFAQARGYAKPAPEVPKPDPVQQIAKTEEARLASMSLGKTGGGITNTGAISPEQLLEMSDAEFEAYKKKHGSVAAAFMN